jgi:hypothetical protein
MDCGLLYTKCVRFQVEGGSTQFLAGPDIITQHRRSFFPDPFFYFYFTYCTQSDPICRAEAYVQECAVRYSVCVCVWVQHTPSKGWWIDTSTQKVHAKRKMELHGVDNSRRGVEWPIIDRLLSPFSLLKYFKPNFINIFPTGEGKFPSVECVSRLENKSRQPQSLHHLFLSHHSRKITFPKLFLRPNIFFRERKKICFFFSSSSSQSINWHKKKKKKEKNHFDWLHYI